MSSKYPFGALLEGKGNNNQGNMEGKDRKTDDYSQPHGIKTLSIFRTKKVGDLDKASGLELREPHGVQADRSVRHGERASTGKGPRRGPHNLGKEIKHNGIDIEVLMELWRFFTGHQ